MLDILCKFAGLAAFPFDELTCGMDIGGWSHGGGHQGVRRRRETHARRVGRRGVGGGTLGGRHEEAIGLATAAAAQPGGRSAGRRELRDEEALHLVGEIGRGHAGTAAW